MRKIAGSTTSCAKKYSQGPRGRWLPLGSSAGSRHVATARRVGQTLPGNADEFVLLADHLAQVEILDRVVRLGNREAAARAVDRRLLDRRDQRLLRLDVAFHRAQACVEHLRRVVAL